jgi:hypothetical protein
VVGIHNEVIVMHKTMLLVAAMILSIPAWGQTSTITTVAPDGTTRSTTASCGSGDCVVWDSTLDLSSGDRYRLLKEQKEFCKTHDLSTQMVKAWDMHTQIAKKNINQECWSAWNLNNIYHANCDRLNKDERDSAALEHQASCERMKQRLVTLSK